MTDALTETTALVDRIVTDACIYADTHHLRAQAKDALLLCHAGPCPLRLAALAEADCANQAHDVFGILRHYCVRSDTLLDCFVPRFAA